MLHTLKLLLEPLSFMKMVSLSNHTLESIGVYSIFEHEQPKYYLLSHYETKPGKFNGLLVFARPCLLLYWIVSYNCFIFSIYGKCL